MNNAERGLETQRSKRDKTDRIKKMIIEKENNERWNQRKENKENKKIVSLPSLRRKQAEEV